MAAGNGGQKMSQYSWFAAYLSTHFVDNKKVILSLRYYRMIEWLFTFQDI